MNEADTGARTERERIAGILRHELWERHRVGLPQRDVLAIADAVLAALGEPQEGPEPSGVALLEYENRNLWWPRYGDFTAVLLRDEAEAEARSLAQDGYRVRIVPLLRGTPVEIRGDV